MKFAHSARTGWIAGLLVAFSLTAPTPASAAPGWNEVSSPAVQTTNCITGVVENLSTSSVAWYGDLASPPPVNTVYYVRVRWGVTGNPCIGGAKVAPELFLPGGSTLSISAANPVKCFAWNVQTGVLTPDVAACPQVPAAGVRGGLGFYPVGQRYVTWPTAQGHGWEIWVPVLSTTSLNGVVNSTDPAVACPNCLTAAVWSIDGVQNPWAYPRVGVLVSGLASIPKITYPTPSTTNVTNTTATGTATLARAGTTGSAFVEISTTPPSGATCVQSGNAIPITAQHGTLWDFPITWTGFMPGTSYYWRFCYVTGSTTYWGVNQLLRTTGTPPPRIIALDRDIGVPGSAVRINGIDLTGATLVSFDVPGTGLRNVTPSAVSPTSVTFVVPPFTYPTNNVTVTVTTPGGTATSPFPFTVGIDTILNSVTVGAFSPNSTQKDDVRIQFHSTEPFPNAEAVCNLDYIPLSSTCRSGYMNYYDLAPGPHLVAISSYANRWHDLTDLIVNFTIANADTTPPNTTIVAGPQDHPFFLVASTSVTFSFSSSETGSTFECLYDRRWWSACVSPYTIAGLALGPHAFQVRAKDAANNVDPTPAHSFYWVTIPASTWIVSGPTNGSTTTSTTATFIFWGINATRFQCSLDGSPFTACRPPKTYAGLAKGPHNFQVRGMDLAGNIGPTPASSTWTIQ